MACHPQFDVTAGGRVTYEDKSASIVRTAPIGGKDIATISVAERNLLNAQLGAYDSGDLSQNKVSYSGLLTEAIVLIHKICCIPLILMGKIGRI